MKIGGVYILSRRSILRILAAFSAALIMYSTATTASIEATVRRIHGAAIALHSLDQQMVGRLTRTVVPDFMYLEYKALYLELKPDVAAFFAVNPIAAVAGRPPSRNGRDTRCPSGERR